MRLCLSFILLFGALPILGQGTPRTLETLSQLLATDPVKFATSGKLVYMVGGYRTNGDWGKPREIAWDRTGTAETNLGCVWAAGPGGTNGQWVAKDCESGELKVEWFGAVSGMLTNSATSPSAIGTDSTAAIQDAIDYLTENGGGNVLLGEGIYWTTNTIFLKPRVALRGLSGGIGIEEVRWGVAPPGDNARLTGASYISGESTSGIGFPLVVMDGQRDFTEMYVASFTNIDGDLVSYYSTGGCAITDIGFQMYQWQFGAEGSGYPIAGIVAKEINGLEISRCAFLTITGHGVYLYGAQGTTVKNCIIHVTFEPAIFVTYVSDCFFYDNIATSPFTFYRANTHTISRNSIYNTKWSWVNYLESGTDVTEYGITRKYINERTHTSNSTNDTFYAADKFGANRGAMVYFVGTNQPSPFTLTNMYFVCPGPTEYTIRLASSPKNAFENTYIDITETKTNGTWSLTSPNQAICGFECEELFANNNRLDQSFADTVLMRRCVRGTINDNQIWEPGLNQTVFRQNKNTADTNVSCIVLDESRNFQVAGNLLHGYYTFSANNSIKQVATYGVKAISSSDVAISGNSYDRLSYGAHADARSVNVRSYDNLSSDTVPYVATSEVTNGVNSRLWEGMRFNGTNLLSSSAIPDSKTNITDFSIALTISDWSFATPSDDYLPLLYLSSEYRTNVNALALAENSVAVFGFQNAGFTNLQLTVSLQGSSTNYRRGILSIREWHDKNIPLELVITRSETNWYLFANGTIRTFPMTITNGASPPDTDIPIHGKHLSFGGWFNDLYYDGWLHSLGLWDKSFTFYEIRDHSFRNNDAVLLWNFRGDVMDTVSDKSQNRVNGTVFDLDSSAKHQFGPVANPGFTEEAYSGGPWVRSNGVWVAMGGPYIPVSDGPFLPLAGGAMVGPVTSSSTWQGTTFTGTSFTGSNYLGTNFTGSLLTARGTSSGLQMFGRSTVTNYWLAYTGASNMVWYYNPGVGGGYNPFIFYTNGSITTVQGTVWNSGNDGSGSTLDADLLDGNNSSAFAASSHNHSGGDINSGTVDASYIDTDIARTNQIFSLVTEQDGSGSMLDADLLDGYDSGDFADSGHDHANTYLPLAISGVQGIVNNGFGITNLQTTPIVGFTYETNAYAVMQTVGEPPYGAMLGVSWSNLAAVIAKFIVPAAPTNNGAYVLFVTNGVASWIAHP